MFERVVMSLEDMLGAEYVEGVCAARACLAGESKAALLRVAREQVDFFPAAHQQRIRELLPRIGQRCVGPLEHSCAGAGGAAFDGAMKRAFAPLSGFGYYRIGEDGRLFLIAKSEHYHAPLGHAFPGYRLLEHARQLGIPNATHNNTRGHITRLLEAELVRAAGCETLRRVINLETGSLAMEAAIKLVLGRFYKAQGDSPEPKYAGRVPVLVVLGDDEGGIQANYHGTTVVAQMMRGMWTELRARAERQELFLVRSVRPNAMEELERVFAEWDTGPYKIAGLFHELVLMNYGGKRLSEAFVRRAYALCEEHDAPPIVDEIQTGIWSPELFMFREYGVKPAMAALGKGFPGGEYPASRILFSEAFDTLPQFGALVTNGQEELASLSYLITMKWAEANSAATRAAGEYYEERLRELGARYPDRISAIEGRRHLAGVYFYALETAKTFVKHVNEAGMDVSVQTYKAGCPPSALTKLPLIVDKEAVDVVIGVMEKAVEN